MGNDYWTNRFPEILTELREEQSNISKPKAEKKTSII